MAFLLSFGDLKESAIVGEEALRRVAREVNESQRDSAAKDEAFRKANNRRHDEPNFEVFADNELTEKIAAFLADESEDASLVWEWRAWDGTWYPNITIEKIGLEQ